MNNINIKNTVWIIYMMILNLLRNLTFEISKLIDFNKWLWFFLKRLWDIEICYLNTDDSIRKLTNDFLTNKIKATSSIFQNNDIM